VIAQFDSLRVVNRILFVNCIFALQPGDSYLFLTSLSLVICAANLLLKLLLLATFVVFLVGLPQFAFLLAGTAHEVFVGVENVLD
jgi:hypothetical protein